MHTLSCIAEHFNGSLQLMPEVLIKAESSEASLCSYSGIYPPDPVSFT